MPPVVPNRRSRYIVEPPTEPRKEFVLKIPAPVLKQTKANSPSCPRPDIFRHENTTCKKLPPRLHFADGRADPGGNSKNTSEIYRRRKSKRRAKKGQRKGTKEKQRKGQGKAKKDQRSTIEEPRRVKEKLRKGWMAEGPRKSQVIDKKGPRKDQGRIKE